MNIEKAFDNSKNGDGVGSEEERFTRNNSKTGVASLSRSKDKT